MAASHLLALAWLSLMTRASFGQTLEMTQHEAPKVCSHYVGCMQGTFMPGYQTEKFEAFLGIPYALPPVKELRFSNPKAHPRWWDVYKATEVKDDCIQKNYLLPNAPIYGKEDCLYLNVYRPEKRSKELLPVMVYIYGGGWFSGSASPQFHGPEYFMDTEEVILVTLSYRVGAFGFLSTNDSNMPGNFGLKDQNLALRWVQKNIVFFGGDPQAVTIFGQSVGGVSVHLHMLSHLSEGLFRGVIALSGTANTPFTIDEYPLEIARKTAELSNITNALELSTAKLTRALRELDAVTLLNAGDGLKYWHVDNMDNYKVVVERSDAKDAFITEHPMKLMAEGRFQPVNLMFGTVAQEGAVRVLSILADEELKSDFNKRFFELLYKMLEFPKTFSSEQIAEKTKRVITEYFHDKQELNDDTAQGFLDIITDRGFHQPLYNTIKAYVESIDTRKHPVYLLKFNYDGPHTHTYANIFTDSKLKRHFGVVHCDDLIYLFRSPGLFTDFDKNSTHAEVVKSLVSNFVHFAKYGKPFNSELLQPCNSDSFNATPETICDYHEYVNVAPASFDIVVNNKFDVRRAQFWNEILKDTNEQDTLVEVDSR